MQYFCNVKHNSISLDAFAKVMMIIDNSRLRYRTRIILSWFASKTWNTASESIVLGLFNLVWWSRLLQPMKNFLNHLVTVLWSTATSSFTQQMFLVASAILWLYLNLSSISSQIRLHSTFICTAFKSHVQVEAVHNMSTHQLPQYYQRKVPKLDSIARSSVQLLNHSCRVKSHAQGVGALTMMLLSTITVTFHILNCFGHLLYMLPTTMCQTFDSP